MRSATVVWVRPSSSRRSEGAQEPASIKCRFQNARILGVPAGTLSDQLIKKVRRGVRATFLHTRRRYIIREIAAIPHLYLPRRRQSASRVCARRIVCNGVFWDFFAK